MNDDHHDPTANHDDLVIRPAAAGDAADIARLLRGLNTHLGHTPVPGMTAADVIAHGFGERPAFEATLALRGGRAVGLALYFFTFSTWRGRPGVYVQDLYVEPEARAAGLGRRLLAAAAAAGAARGCDHLRLSVALTNLEAQKFYHRLGLEPADGDVTYRLDGDGFHALVAATAGGAGRRGPAEGRGPGAC
jgi:ribosomal protein S18 acetylase RimI-like enzyme